MCLLMVTRWKEGEGERWGGRGNKAKGGSEQREEGKERICERKQARYCIYFYLSSWQFLSLDSSCIAGHWWERDMILVIFLYIEEIEFASAQKNPLLWTFSCSFLPFFSHYSHLFSYCVSACPLPFAIPFPLSMLIPFTCLQPFLPLPSSLILSVPSVFLM